MILTPSAISCHELRISPVQLLRGLKCEYSTGLGSWCLFDCIVWIWGFNDFLYRLVTNPSFQPHSHSLLVPGPSWGLYGASQVVLVVKKLPTNAETQEMQVQSLGREDPLEEGMATHSSILAWRIPWMEELRGLWSKVLQRGKHSWRLSTHLTLGLYGVNSLVLCLFHWRYLAISILSLQTFGDASQVYLSGFCFFLWLNSHFRGFGGQWRQMHMNQSSILKLNMRTQRSIEKF